MGKKRYAPTKGKPSSPQCPENIEELKELLGMDTLPGGRHNQDIFLRWVQQELQKKGGLEKVLKEKNTLLAELAATERDSDEDLDKMARRTRFNGFIQPLSLARILAAEEECNGILPKLWDYFECDGKGINLKTDTPNALKYGWYRFILRIAGVDRGTPQGGSGRIGNHPILGRLPHMQNYLRLYGQDPATGEFKLKPLKDRSDADFIKLEDLGEYLKDMGRAMEVDVPLPKRLFLSTRPNANVLSELPRFTHSPDFRCINKNGEIFTLTPNQAQVVQMLFDAREGKIPDLGQVWILDRVSPDTSTKRLRDIFKNNLAAWEALIEPGSKKGTFRLKL